MDISDLDFSTMQDIPPLCRYHDTPRVTVSAKGYLSINTALQKRTGYHSEFYAKVSADGRYLALYPEKSPNVCFTNKNYRIKYRALAEFLEKAGLLLPAVYTMEWCQEQSAWVGCCSEISNSPAPATLSASRRASQKKARQAP